MYLVQRCTPKIKLYAGEKVSDYMSLDYMGSAEFEFGAIPKSIRKLANKDLVIQRMPYMNKKGKKVVIHVLADREEMKEAIQQLFDHLEPTEPYGNRLKELNSFRPRVLGTTGYDRQETFWWCVDENSNVRDPAKDTALNFCWSLDPEQVRCFKLALRVSLDFMDKDRKEAAETMAKIISNSEGTLGVKP